MIELVVAENYYRMDIPDNVTNGVVVYEVESGSCAEAAGLKSQDIILEFDNVKITSSAELKYELDRKSVV